MKNFKFLNQLGCEWVRESSRCIAQCVYFVELANKKISTYEQADWYQADSMRQAILIKRNERINLALDEARKWEKFAGKKLFNLPANCRPWEEDVKEQEDAIRNFLLLSKILISRYEEQGVI